MAMSSYRIIEVLSQTKSWGRGALPYLKMLRNFRSINPRLWHFPIPLGPFYAKHDLIDPHFLQNI